MRSWHLSLVALFLLCGCTSRIPEPVAYPYSQQHKMQASAHWQVLAADLADRINRQLIMSGNSATTVFVKQTCGDEKVPCQPHETSSFDEAFRDLLITDLVNLGVPTRHRPDQAAIEIDYKVQLVRHNSTRFRTLQPGLLTALSGAVLVLRDAPSDLLVLAAGMAADLANTSLVAHGQYEIIITTSMVNGGQYLFRSSDIYYINDRDFQQYRMQPPQTKTIMLSGDTGRQY